MRAINKEHVNNVLKWITLIVLLQAAWCVLIYLRGGLNEYIPAALISVFISITVLIFAGYYRADFRFFVVALILLSMGNVMQNLVAVQNMFRFAIIEFAAFIIGSIVAAAMVRFSSAVSIRRQKTCIWIFLFILFAVLAVFGKSTYGTKAWISIAGVSFQVTEVIKVLVIYYFGLVMSGDDEETRKFISCLVMLGVNGIFFAVIREFGTLIVLMVILLLLSWMFFEKMRYCILSCFFIVVAGSAGLFASYNMNLLVQKGAANKWIVFGASIWKKLTDRLQLLTALDKVDPYSVGYQSITARKAMNLGGWFGNIYDVKIPVADSDYVYTALIMHMGFVMAVLVLILFLCLLVSGVQISLREMKSRKRYIATGFVLVIFVQSVLTIFGSTNFFFLMGMPIAFLSSGGSNQLCVFTMMMFLLFSGKKNRDNN